MNKNKFNIFLFIWLKTIISNCGKITWIVVIIVIYFNLVCRIQAGWSDRLSTSRFCFESFCKIIWRRHFMQCVVSLSVRWCSLRITSLTLILIAVHLSFSPVMEIILIVSSLKRYKLRSSLFIIIITLYLLKNCLDMNINHNLVFCREYLLCRKQT